MSYTICRGNGTPAHAAFNGQDSGRAPNSYPLCAAQVAPDVRALLQAVLFAEPGAPPCLSGEGGVACARDVRARVSGAAATVAARAHGREAERPVLKHSHFLHSPIQNQQAGAEAGPSMSVSR